MTCWASVIWVGYLSGDSAMMYEDLVSEFAARLPVGVSSEVLPDEAEIQTRKVFDDWCSQGDRHGPHLKKIWGTQKKLGALDV